MKMVLCRHMSSVLSSSELLQYKDTHSLDICNFCTQFPGTVEWNSMESSDSKGKNGISFKLASSETLKPVSLCHKEDRTFRYGVRFHE
jgi:hypothetical protein